MFGLINEPETKKKVVKMSFSRFLAVSGYTLLTQIYPVNAAANYTARSTSTY